MQIRTLATRFGPAQTPFLTYAPLHGCACRLKRRHPFAQPTAQAASSRGPAAGGAQASWCAAAEPQRQTLTKRHGQRQGMRSTRGGQQVGQLQAVGSMGTAAGHGSRPPAREVERSALVNEEVVYFIFQLDLDVQLQRNLNNEAYEAAQEVRKKRQLVDEAMAAMAKRKASNVGSEAASAALSAADFASEGLRLRAAMVRAVESEDYKEAARCRDLLSKLESSAKQVQALAAEYTGGSTFKPRLRLGQRIVHRVHGYRGVVVGWDAQCCEAEDWVEANGGAGVNQAQPFYHVLVDQRDWEFDAYQPPVAYVAEELCWTPEDGGPPPAAMPRHPNAPGPFLSAGVAGSPVPTTASSAAAGAASLAATSAYPRPAPASGKSNTPATKGVTQAMQGPGTAASSSTDSEEDSGGVSWMEMFGSEPLEHPYRYILFLGQDARGDYMPCR
ncbi:hypothetical protein V8C86DRAFT_2474337 [Haematococcus lacustris]